MACVKHFPHVRMFPVVKSSLAVGFSGDKNNMLNNLDAKK